MNSNLANQLLASIMKWDAPTLASERAALEFMGSMKYDAYDRYMPGMRFMSSLVQWLNQFDEEDRATVLNFVKKKLVFISSPQMNYLVDLLYDSKIRPILLRKATENAQTPSYILCNKKVQKQFEIEKRSSLVVGLSDGAHTDILRRSAGFSNEQVLTNYYPDGKKLKDMLKDLREDKKLEGVENVYFRNIFLIDDFTASGKSFVRYDEKAKKFKGKLSKIIDELYATNIEPTEEEKKKGKKEELHLSYLLDANQPEIHIDILFCMATQKAEDNIRKSLDDFLKKRSYGKIKYHIHVVQKLDESLNRDITGDPNLMRVLEKPKYLHQNLKDDTAYKVGSVNRPYLGFDECALPVVLSHNTPNNSLPILWQDTDDEKQFKGLFPRISRH